MKLDKKRSTQRKKTMKRKTIKGGYDWRENTPKKNKRNRGRGTRKTNK